MPEINKAKVKKGRLAVDTYREAHRQLHLQPCRRTIPEEHTPLLNTMLADLKKQDFNSLDEFFTASEELNLVEIGFASRREFDTAIIKFNINAEKYIELDEDDNPVEVVIDTPETKALGEILDRMWH